MTGASFCNSRADISHSDVQRFLPPHLKPGLPVSTYLKDEKDQNVKRLQLERAWLPLTAVRLCPR